MIAHRVNRVSAVLRLRRSSYAVGSRDGHVYRPSGGGSRGELVPVYRPSEQWTLDRTGIAPVNTVRGARPLPSEVGFRVRIVEQISGPEMSGSHLRRAMEPEDVP